MSTILMLAVLAVLVGIIIWVCCVPRVTEKMVAVLVFLMTASVVVAADEDLAKCRECLDSWVGQLQSLPEQESFKTLDGQEIAVAALRAYRQLNPFFVVPFKFYYWESEVREIQMEGKNHIARIYWTPASSCFEAMRKPEKKWYGDFAEIYWRSEGNKLTLIGFACYADDGKYVILRLLKGENSTPL